VEKSDAEIRAERSKRYGDHVPGHQNLGMAWTGLIQNHYGIRLPHPLPAFLVELMMVASKANRAAVNPAGRDNYKDGRIYFAMAEEAASKELPDGTSEPKES
jgi:hypothetical protein